MLTKTWFQKFKDARFLATNDERCVFYPFGPLRGYLLPCTLMDRWARTIFWWELISLVCVWIVSWFVSPVFQCDFPVAFLMGAAGFLLPYAIGIRWLTQRFQSLPCRISIQTYAALRDPQALREQCLFGSLAMISTAVLAVIGTERAFWFILAIFSLCITFIPAYILFIRSRLVLANSLSGDVNEDVASNS